MSAILHVSAHPLVKHKLTLLRDTATDYRKFRELVRELALLLCYEATSDLALVPATVNTPMGEAKGWQASEVIGVVPILRAGLGLVDGIQELLPNVQVWHIGLYRDEETLRPVEYYNRLPARTHRSTLPGPGSHVGYRRLCHRHCRHSQTLGRETY